MMNIGSSKTAAVKPRPVDSLANLRDRIDRLFRSPIRRPSLGTAQILLGLDVAPISAREILTPSNNIGEFMDFITDILPDGDVFLFGGVLRDIALLGRSGFNSDIDLVVEGNWENCVTYLESLGAQKNKFGGYRLSVAGWPIDIWSAKKTWAIEKGLVRYRGIQSLTETTVLNWDAILMNWRTKRFVLQDNYLEMIKSLVLDIVLEENPNPLGMAVRVFRHLCLKDARKITPAAARYLAGCTAKYRFQDIYDAEIRSYGNSVIEPNVYRLFEHLKDFKKFDIRKGYSLASDALQQELELA